MVNNNKTRTVLDKSSKMLQNFDEKLLGPFWILLEWWQRKVTKVCCFSAEHVFHRKLRVFNFSKPSK